MVLLGVFLFNLLCGLVPCDPSFGFPKINPNSPLEIGFRDGRPANKLEIPARVTITSGKLEGYHMKTVLGRTFFAFEGVPYGEEPKRWQPPVMKGEWRGTLEAKKPGSDCLQISAAKFIRVYGENDCLFVNIFTPDLPYKGNSPNYPVIIYFHAGSFFMGSGSEHGPTYMLDEDIILVTVNYRLGVLGFLSTGDSVIPGNWGLKDQALSIEWVHQNIAKFGGDPNNINLWGYSGGGVSVHLHMISNKTRHLFTKAISLGAGSAYQHWAVQKPWRARNYTNRVGRRFGCPNHDSEILANCLRKIPSINLVADQLNLFDWFPFPGTLFSPTIEPDHPDAFLIESPQEAYALGHVAKKPWILSTTSHEGLTAVLVLELFLRWLPLRLAWKTAAKSYLDYGYIAENSDEITDKITKFYLGDKSPLRGTLFEYASMLTDRYFRVGVLNGLQAHSQIAPTYSYYFSFNKGYHTMGGLYGHKPSEWRPGHIEDEYYFLNCSTQYAGFKENEPDYKMGKVMINFLVNFVYTGEPYYTTDEGEEMRVWEPVTNASNIRMLQMDQEVKMINMPDLHRLKFWQDLKLKDAVPLIPIS